MTSARKVKESQLPGNRLKNLARRSRVAGTVLSHTHMLQIIDDHQAMWLAAEGDEERRRIRQRLNRQLARATMNFSGLEVTIHGATIAITDPLSGGSLVLLGIALMYFTSGKG